MLYAAKISDFALMLILAVIMTGCNDEVFVEKLDPSDTELTIGGNGDRGGVGYESSNLVTLSLDVFSEQKPNVTYFDRDGNRIEPEGNASRLAKIKYKSQTMEYVISVGKNLLMFESVENFSTLDSHVTIRLDYGFTVRFIKVTMTGLPIIDLVDIAYDMDRMSVSQDPVVVSANIKYKNDGNSSPWEISLKPYLSISAHVELEPAAGWARYLRNVYSIPTLQGGIWGLHGKSIEMMMSSKGYYRSTEVDENTSVPVTIPPFESRTVVENVFFNSMSVPFTAVFKNPVTGREYSTTGICKVCEPFDYEVKVLEEK